MPPRYRPPRAVTTETVQYLTLVSNLRSKRCLPERRGLDQDRPRGQRCHLRGSNQKRHDAGQCQDQQRRDGAPPEGWRNTGAGGLIRNDNTSNLAGLPASASTGCRPPVRQARLHLEQARTGPRHHPAHRPQHALRRPPYAGILLRTEGALRARPISCREPASATRSP